MTTTEEAPTLLGPDGEPIVVRVVDTDTAPAPSTDPDPDEPIKAEVVAFDPNVAGSADSGALALVPARDELRGLAEMSVTLATAGNVPKALRGKPADVFLVLLTARDLGVSITTALRTFHVIDGSVTVAPKARLAMLRRDGLGRAWPHQAPRQRLDDDGQLVDEWCACGSDDPANGLRTATWHAERADDPGIIYSATFTWEQADVAGLVKKDNWRSYPGRMLSWRALGYVLDDAFPEVGTGLYQPDELGAVTDEDGNPVFSLADDANLVGARSAPPRSHEANLYAPANPTVVADLGERIKALEVYEGARETLIDLWKAPDDGGNPKLPPLAKLLHSQEKVAAALVDSIERRAKHGEFGEPRPTEPAAEGEPAPTEPATDSPSPEGPEAAAGQEAPQEPVEAPESAVAPEPETEGLTDAEANEAIEQSIAEVKAMDLPAVKVAILERHHPIGPDDDEPLLRRRLATLLAVELGVVLDVP